MGIRRLGTVALLLSLLSLTLPVQTVLAQGYLDVTAVHAPESVIVGQIITLSVSVKWSSLHTYAWGNPVYVRAEICEGTDLTKCNPLAFAPSADGEPIRDESGFQGSTIYSFTIHAPEMPKVWHLIAIFEILHTRGWITNAVPPCNADHCPWHKFDILVKPSENALLTSRTLFEDSFESGFATGGWQVKGITSTVDKDPILNFPNLLEGHTGRFAALLGIDWSGGTLKGIPREAGLAYEFSLRKDVAVTPGSDLTVTFWFRGVYPYVYQTGPLRNMFLTYSVDSTVGKLDEVTFHEEDWLPPAWRSVTRSMSVPVQVSTVTLLFYGRGEIPPAGPGAGAFELDDVLVTESTFSVSTTTTTLASTTASQTEMESSSTVVSASSVQTAPSPAAPSWNDFWSWLQSLWCRLLGQCAG